MKKILFTLIVFSFGFAHAAGYLEFDTNGTPYKWDKSTQTVKIDLGTLGDYPKTDMVVTGSDNLVAEAFSVWENIGGGLAFHLATPSHDTSADITYQNLSTFVDFNGTTCKTPDFVVVYDDANAAIADQIFSKLFPGQSDSILGFASPSVLSDSTKKITCGYAFINGFAISGTTLTDQNNIKYTMMHEFGHAQNLEHSQINEDIAFDSNPVNDGAIPLMFPYIPDGISQALSAGPNSDGIKLDDQFSFLYLYGSLATNGRINGKILQKSGEGVLGVNVLCYDKANPLTNVVSWVSGSDLDGDGSYVCGNLPNGDYQIKIEPIKYAINAWDEGLPPVIPVEYYNGSNESFNASTDSLTEKTDVTVTAGTQVNDINILINNNGQITSQQKISSSISGDSSGPTIADLEYYIYVPKNVTKATFSLKADPTSRDLDIFGKCDSPFSIALTSPSIYDPTSTDQQAEFAGVGDTGEESVTLDSKSTPKLQNCEYHLLIINYDTTSADFELTATLEGPEPKLKANFLPEKKVQSNGDTLVSTVIFEANNDQFTINSATFTDLGVLPIKNVTGASLYFDTNGNGKVDSEDTLVSSTSTFDTTKKTFTFSKLDIFLDEGEQKNFLLTYNIPSASTFPGSLVVFILGAIGFAVIRRNKKILTFAVITVSLLTLNRCSGSSSSDYNPTIQTSEDVSAQASGFGALYTVQIGAPSSVKDFFELNK